MFLYSVFYTPRERLGKLFKHLFIFKKFYFIFSNINVSYVLCHYASFFFFKNSLYFGKNILPTHFFSHINGFEKKLYGNKKKKAFVSKFKNIPILTRSVAKNVCIFWIFKKRFQYLLSYKVWVGTLPHICSKWNRYWCCVMWCSV